MIARRSWIVSILSLRLIAARPCVRTTRKVPRGGRYVSWARPHEPRNSTRAGGWTAITLCPCGALHAVHSLFCFTLFVTLFVYRIRYVL